MLREWLGVIGMDAKKIQRSALCSVVPAVQSAFSESLEKISNVAPRIVNAESKLNFGFNYPNHTTLGADRIANLIAARHFFGENLIIADFGTAITFCVLTDSKFIGGVISPGIASSLEALFAKAAKLPKIIFRNNGIAIGKSTIQSIEIGAYLGWKGLIRETLTEIKSELPENGARHTVIATGGISENLDFAQEFFDVVDKNLTLRGLNLSMLDLF